MGRQPHLQMASSRYFLHARPYINGHELLAVLDAFCELHFISEDDEVESTCLLISAVPAYTCRR